MYVSKMVGTKKTIKRINLAPRLAREEPLFMCEEAILYYFLRRVLQVVDRLRLRHHHVGRDGRLPRVLRQESLHRRKVQEQRGLRAEGAMQGAQMQVKKRRKRSFPQKCGDLDDVHLLSLLKVSLGASEDDAQRKRLRIENRCQKRPMN
jgi:hypothetical protein